MIGARHLACAATAAAIVMAAAGCGADTSSSSAPAASTSTAAASASTSPAASTGRVTIKNFAFGPQTTTVPSGTTVTWTNSDASAHTVMSDTSAFASGSLATGQTYAFTFAKAGTYTYHCAIHNYMTGTVVVTG